MHWKNSRQLQAKLTAPLLLTFVIAFCALCAYRSTAPVRALPSVEFLRTAAKNTIAVDDDVRRAIVRAQRDYFLHPVDFRSPRKLEFDEAFKAPPNDIYLAFYLKNHAADFVILYCVAGEDSRLLWKSGINAE